MSVPHLRVFREESAPATTPAWAILLSSYSSGATEGNRLGTAGYSYDFVARLFAPLLERLGKLVEIKKLRTGLPAAIETARREGLEPVHVSFRPFQDAWLSPAAQNVMVPAWEFPDIPNECFDGNPQNNWVKTANRCSLVLVGGPFTAKALDAAGVTAPIRIVPVPTPTPYFDLAGWRADAPATLACSPYVLPEAGVQTRKGRSASVPALSRTRRFRETVRVTGVRTYRNVIKPYIPSRIAPVVASALMAGVKEWRQQSVPYRRSKGLTLGGVVYTSIFNPDDGRKNWKDTITAFLHALRDCDDATLVLKLITSNRQAIGRLLSFYHRLDVSHRCRLVVIPDFLSEADMFELARATTFYLTTTRAEGNCLPLMNYLAAGRPGVAPSHTAIADYFDSDVGFVVESHPEPCTWPQDTRHCWRSTWHRLVWTSLVEQLRCSYQMAKNDQAAYEAMAAAARERMTRWSHPESVWPHLRSAIELLAPAAEPAQVDRVGTSNIKPRPMVAPRIATNGGGLALYPSDRSSDPAPMRVVVSLLSFRPPGVPAC